MKAFTQYQNYLIHHGRKGQHWGVRNGPPYPLGASNKKYKQMVSKQVGIVEEPYTKDNISKNDWNRMLKMVKDSEKETPAEQAKMDEVARKEKRNTKALLALSVISTPISPLNLISDVELAAKLYKNYSAEKTEKALLKQIENNPKIDSKTGFKLKQKEMTMAQDMAMINPGFKTFNDSYKHNCIYCTVAYDLRRRGYDVMANKSPKDQVVGQFFQWYPKAKMVPITRSPGSNQNDYMKEIEQELIKQGNGARGDFSVEWLYGRGGHSMAYEIINNKLVVLDTQSNTIYKDASFFVSRAESVCYTRLDNIDIDPKTIKKAVRP